MTVEKFPPAWEKRLKNLMADAVYLATLLNEQVETGTAAELEATAKRVEAVIEQINGMVTDRGRRLGDPEMRLERFLQACDRIKGMRSERTESSQSQGKTFSDMKGIFGGPK